MSKITSEISRIVEQACKLEDNIFGYSAWSHHIVNVVEFSKLLADKLNADEEVVELAALLHDYASVLDKKLYPEHHLHGSRLARELLEKYDYAEEKIVKIEHAILTHRGSKNIKRETMEAEILASADAMAHFSNIDSLLYLAYKSKNMDVDEGRNFLLGKLERSFNKILPEAKEIVLPLYDAAKILFSKLAV